MDSAVENPATNVTAIQSGWWERLRRALSCVRVRRAPRRLRLCESLALGEKRFVAVIQFEEQRFLVGGGVNSISLLARLGDSPDFAALLRQGCERQP